MENQNNPTEKNKLLNHLSQNQIQSLDEIEDRLKEIKERTTAFVKKNPLTSIAIAVVVGYFVGKIFSGRRQ